MEQLSAFIDGFMSVFASEGAVYSLGLLCAKIIGLLIFAFAVLMVCTFAAAIMRRI